MNSPNQARRARRGDGVARGADTAKGVELYTLGGVRLMRGGIDETGKLGAKHLALLIYLFHERRPMHPSEVTELLGRGQSQDRETEALRRAIAYLTDKVSGVNIRVVADTVEAVSGVLVDTREVDAAIDGGDPWHVAKLWVGDFLQGFESGAPAFDEWVERERTRLRRAWSNATLNAARKVERKRDWEKAAQWWQILLTQAPGRTESVAGLLNAYARGGRDREAARTYAEYLALVGEEPGGPPAPIRKVFDEFPTLAALVEKIDLALPDELPVPAARPESPAPEPVDEPDADEVPPFIEHEILPATDLTAEAAAEEEEEDAAPVPEAGTVQGPDEEVADEAEELAAAAVTAEETAEAESAPEAEEEAQVDEEDEPVAVGSLEDEPTPDVEAEPVATSAEGASALELETEPTDGGESAAPDGDDEAWEEIVGIASTDELDLDIALPSSPSHEPPLATGDSSEPLVLPEEATAVEQVSPATDATEEPVGVEEAGETAAAFTDTTFEKVGDASAVSEPEEAVARAASAPVGSPAGTAEGSVAPSGAWGRGKGGLDRALGTVRRKVTARGASAEPPASRLVRRFWYVPVGLAAIGLALVAGPGLVGVAGDLTEDVRAPAIPAVSPPSVAIPQVTVKAPPFVETSVAKIGEMFSGSLLEESGRWVLVADLEMDGPAADASLALAAREALESELSEASFFYTVPRERALVALDRVSGGNLERLSLADALTVAQDMGYAMVITGRIIPGTPGAGAGAAIVEGVAVEDVGITAVEPPLGDSVLGTDSASAQGAVSGGAVRAADSMFVDSADSAGLVIADSLASPPADSLLPQGLGRADAASDSAGAEPSDSARAAGGDSLIRERADTTRAEGGDGGLETDTASADPEGPHGAGAPSRYGPATQDANTTSQDRDTTSAATAEGSVARDPAGVSAQEPDSAVGAVSDSGAGRWAPDSSRALVPDSIQLSIFDPRGRELYGIKAELSPETGGLAAMEELANVLRRRLGEASEEIESSPGAGEVLSLSAEALAAYSRAKMHLYAGRWAQAIRAARVATRHDSTFAGAYQAQAEAYAMVGQRARARSMLEAAYQARRRAPERERFRIQADRLAWDGRAEAALIAYEELFQRYRDDAGALKAEALIQWQIGVRGGGEGNLRVAYSIDRLDWPRLDRLARYLGYRGRLPDVDSLIAAGQPGPAAEP